MCYNIVILAIVITFLQSTNQMRQLLSNDIILLMHQILKAFLYNCLL